MKKFIFYLITVVNIHCYSQNSVEENWVFHFPQVFDYANFFIVDMESNDQGYLYLTGYHQDNIQGNEDIITVKIIMSSWIVEWINIYDGPQGGVDLCKDLEIDNQGNCYVTGGQINTSNYDYLTIKYNKNGQIEWTQIYDGLKSETDFVYGLFVDNSGNAYITGGANEVSAFYSSATTIKYNTNGTMEWKATYIDSNTYDDEGRGIVVDNAGNVYVAGYTYMTTTDFLIIKYNSTGTEQWVRSPGYATNEIADYIAVDSAGKIIAGGTAFDYGYRVVKYNPDGSLVFGSVYNSLATMRGMVLSPQGNIYVTGSQSGGSIIDYSTVKFDGVGATGFVWEKKFNGGFADYANDIEIDADENIYVTGSSLTAASQSRAVTIKYNSSGDSLWASIYDNPMWSYTVSNRIIIDEDENLFLAIYNGEANFNNYPGIIKLTNNGSQLWVSDFKSFCQPTSIKNDTQGNIYITGYGGLDNTMYDYITMKCDSSGNIIWLRTYNGPANVTDQAYDIDIDANGNVFVTGGSKGIGTDFDFTTIKYDALGDKKWVLRYNGPAFDADIANYLSIDVNGNIYVSGSSINSNNDIATVKYNSLGQLQWVRRYNGTSNGTDLSQGLRLDLAGNVYVAGTSDSTASLYDYVTVKYDPSGNTQWIKKYNGPANDGDIVSTLTLDNLGNVYVTGWSFGNGTQSDYATVKYSSLGTEQWVARWDDPANSYDYANDIAVDDDGNVYVTGVSQGMGTDNDFTTVKYNSFGQQQWAVPYNGQSNGSDVAYCVALDYLGDVYISGFTNNNAEISTVKYNKQGMLEWEINFNNSNYQDSPNDLLVDNSGNVIVAGYSSQSGQEWIWSIIKYRQPDFVPSDAEQEPIYLSDFTLYQNYPNPFNPATTIQFSIPEHSFVKLEVFNTLGEKISTLVSKELNAGNYKYEWNAENLSSGIYFYRVSTNKFSEIKKMMLIK